MGGCGDDEPAPAGPVDEAPPNATEARFVEFEGGGGLRLEVDAADDEQGCGIVSARASVVGLGMRLAYEVALSEDPGGAWVAELSEDRCAPAGKVQLGFLALRDAGGNEREFRYARGENYLQATDHNIELPIPHGQLGARRGDPEISEILAVAPGRVEVVHDGADCGPMAGWVRARGPDGDDIRLDHVGTVEPGREAFSIPGGVDCLAEGAWQVHEVVLQAPYGGGAVRLEEESGLPTFEVTGTGLSERLPVLIEAFRLEAEDPGAARVVVDLHEASCAVTERSGELRRLLPDGSDPVIRRAPFGDDGVARLSECAGDGQWWLSRIVLKDGAGGVWPWRLRTDDPSLGYREDPALDVPRLESPF